MTSPGLMFHGLRGSREHEVGMIGDELGHHPLIPLVAERIGPIVSHDERDRLGGQGAAHLQVGDDLEVVCLAEQIERGDPVLRVRAACEAMVRVADWSP